MGWGKKFMQTIGLAAAIGSSEQAFAKEKAHEGTQPSNKEQTSHHEKREVQVDPFAAARTEAIDLINNDIDTPDSFGTRLVGNAKMELVPSADGGLPKLKVTVESNGKEVVQTYVVTVDKATGAKSFATNEKTGQVEDEDDMRIRIAAEKTVAEATGAKGPGGVAMNK